MTDTVIVDTPLGRLRGRHADGTSTFRGIPYAAGTSGPNRFLPPQPVSPWAGVRDALEHGPRAPQLDLPRTRIFQWLVSELGQDEDCLVLNVYTPAADTSRRPVMVYLHGGAFASGSSSSPVLDGSTLARQEDVVVVTVNHRLNLFGYLCPLPHSEARFADAGNAGMLDLVAALQWVRDTIGRFGGDPSNVTIFGQSGGGAKVAILMAMEAARGLFHRAIVQSSSSGLRVQARDECEAGTRALFRKLELPEGDFAALQAVPAATLLRAMQHVIVAQRGQDSFRPVIDGRSLHGHPFHPSAPTISAHIPLLVGHTRTESTFFLAADPSNFALSDETARQRLQRFLRLDDAATDRLLAVYRAQHPGASASQVFAFATSDFMYRLNNITGAEQKAKQAGAPVFMYEFAWESPALDGRLMSPHTAEIPFVFGHVEMAAAFTGHGPELQPLMQQVMKAWAGFARTGQPGHAGLPDWKPFTPDERWTMLLQRDCTLVNDPRGAEREAMAQVPAFHPGSSMYVR